MPRVCSACSHANTAQIAKAIASGDGSNRSLATRFGLTVSAVQRHRVGCLRQPRRTKETRDLREPTSPAGSVRFESQDPASLISTTARLVDEALSLLEHAKSAGDHRTALQALREARDGLALLMRTRGMLAGDAGSTVIDQRRQIINVLGGLSEDELRALATGKPIEGTALALPAEIIDAEIGTDIRDVKALTPS
jgi:hypothetical protein